MIARSEDDLEWKIVARTRPLKNGHTIGRSPGSRRRPLRNSEFQPSTTRRNVLATSCASQAVECLLLIRVYRISRGRRLSCGSRAAHCQHFTFVAASGADQTMYYRKWETTRGAFTPTLESGSLHIAGRMALCRCAWERSRGGRERSSRLPIASGDPLCRSTKYVSSTSMAWSPMEANWDRICSARHGIHRPVGERGLDVLAHDAGIGVSDFEPPSTGLPVEQLLGEGASGASSPRAVAILRRLDLVIVGMRIWCRVGARSSRSGIS